jgi:hypothetical protein
MTKAHATVTEEATGEVKVIEILMLRPKRRPGLLRGKWVGRREGGTEQVRGLQTTFSD